jgi:hypothetical protein
MANKKADEDAKNAAVEMWNSGKSSGDIAHDLGFTRSQVMGIIHRAKKAGKAIVKGPPPKEVVPKAAISKVVPPFVFGKMVTGAKMAPTPMKPEPVLKADKSYRGPKNIMNVGDGDCRWVVSSGLFCARPVCKAGKSWCEEHHKIVYVKSTEREKKAHAEVLMQKLRFNF